MCRPVYSLEEPFADNTANMVAYLSSPAADFITGVNLRVDGGMMPITNDTKGCPITQPLLPVISLVHPMLVISAGITARTF